MLFCCSALDTSSLTGLTRSIREKSRDSSTEIPDVIWRHSAGPKRSIPHKFHGTTLSKWNASLARSDFYITNGWKSKQYCRCSHETERDMIQQENVLYKTISDLCLWTWRAFWGKWSISRIAENIFLTSRDLLLLLAECDGWYLPSDCRDQAYYRTGILGGIASLHNISYILRFYHFVF